jgi:hypothetical protein
MTNKSSPIINRKYWERFAVTTIVVRYKSLLKTSDSHFFWIGERSESDWLIDSTSAVRFSSIVMTFMKKKGSLIIVSFLCKYFFSVTQMNICYPYRRWQWRSYGRITGINHESQAGAAVCGINNCQAVHGISYDCWAGMKIGWFFLKDVNKLLIEMS